MSVEDGDIHVGFRGPDIWQVRDGDTAEWVEPIGTREEAERICECMKQAHRSGYAAGIAAERARAAAVVECLRQLNTRITNNLNSMRREVVLQEDELELYVNPSAKSVLTAYDAARKEQGQ